MLWNITTGIKISAASKILQNISLDIYFFVKFTIIIALKSKTCIVFFLLCTQRQHCYPLVSVVEMICEHKSDYFDLVWSPEPGSCLWRLVTPPGWRVLASSRRKMITLGWSLDYTGNHKSNKIFDCYLQSWQIFSCFVITFV